LSTTLLDLTLLYQLSVRQCSKYLTVYRFKLLYKVLSLVCREVSDINSFVRCADTMPCDLLSQ